MLEGYVLGLAAARVFLHFWLEGSVDEILATFAAEISGALDQRDFAPEPELDTVQEKPTRLSFEKAIRKLNQRGLRVGAYGWVVNLRPLPAAAPLATPPGETGPVHPLAGDPGFLHAPSIEQAQAAALLRSGHLGKAQAQAGGAFAVDLSSRRVRIAFARAPPGIQSCE